MNQCEIGSFISCEGVSFYSEKIINEFDLLTVDLNDITPESLMFGLSGFLLSESSSSAWDDITGPMYD